MNKSSEKDDESKRSMIQTFPQVFGVEKFQANKCLGKMNQLFYK